MTNTVPTPDVSDQPTDPITKTGAELAVGDWVASCCGYDEPGKVLGVHPYTEDDTPYVLTVFRTVSGDTPVVDHLNAEERVALAPKADVDAAKDKVFRRDIVKDVHNLANMLADFDQLLPGRRRSVDLDIQLASLDELTAVSQVLDIDVAVDPAGRHSVFWPKDCKTYEPGVHVEWFLYVKKEPKTGPLKKCTHGYAIEGGIESCPNGCGLVADSGMTYSREPDAPTATPVPKGVDGRPVGKRTPAKAARP